MLRDTYSDQDKCLITKRLISLNDLFIDALKSFKRYWKYLKIGKNPSLTLLFLEIVDSRIERLNQKDFERLINYLSEEYERDPEWTRRVTDYFFPAFKEFISDKKLSFDEVLKEYFQDQTTEEVEEHFLHQLWKRERSSFSSSLSPPLFFRPREIGFLSLFIGLFDPKLEDDLFSSSGSLFEWFRLGDFREGAKNLFSISWKVVWVETDSDAFHGELERRWEDSSWEQLQLRCGLLPIAGQSYHRQSLSRMVEEMEERRKEKVKGGEKRNKKGITDRTFYEKTVIDELRDELSVDLFQVVSNPISRLVDLYLYFQARERTFVEASNENDLIEKLSEKYREILEGLFPRLIGKIQKVFLVFEIFGPQVIDESSVPLGISPVRPFNYGLPFNVEDLTDQVNHPYVKTQRKRVVFDRKPLFRFLFEADLSSSEIEIAERIEKKLKTVRVIPEDLCFVAISPSLLQDFQEWCLSRLEEFEAEKKVKALWPLITSDQFISKMEKRVDVAEQLVIEIRELKKTLKVLVSSEKHDLDLLKGILRNDFQKTGRREYSREVVLEIWAKYLIKTGDKKSEGYLVKGLLPSRLSAIVNQLKRKSDPHLEITKVQGKRGAPQLFLRWKS